MTEPTALAQLRHLYQNMVNGAVRDTASAKRIAEGLLAPAIEALERGTPPAVAGEPVAGCSECYITHDLGACDTEAPVAQGDALIDFIESAGSVHIHRVRAGFNGPIRWDVEYGYEDAKVSGRTLRDALSGVLKAGAASAAKELGA